MVTSNQSKSIFLVSGIVAAGLLVSSCGLTSRVGNAFNRGEDVRVEPSSIEPISAQLGSADGEMIQSIKLSDKAQADLSTNFRNDPANKAFAVSPSGAFGVAFGAATMREAKQAALEKCMQDVVIGDLECVVYNVNDVVVFRPRRLRRVR